MPDRENATQSSSTSPLAGILVSVVFVDFSPLLIFLRTKELRVSLEVVNTSHKAARKKNLWLLWT